MPKHTLLFILLFPIFLFAQTQDIPLPATWVFHKVGEPIWQPAIVPGTVHTDLLRNRRIENPFWGSNERELQALEQGIYEYEGKFNITQKQLSAQNIQLIFEGLDTYSLVKLNEVEILRSNNMFRTFPLSVKKRLKEGENTLFIRFYPAADSGKILAQQNPYRLPEKERIYTRKAQYQYGWDWAPRFVTCGIWKPIRLQCNWALELQDVQFVQDSLSPALAKMTAKLTIFSDTFGTKKVQISDLGNRVSIEKRVALHKGINTITVPFEVKKPHLWFPNGYGEPYLYQFNIKLIDNKKVEDIKSLSWGFRTVEVVQEKDSVGRSFYLKINGIPIFIKGANWIPAESFPTNISFDFKDKSTQIPNIPRLIAAAKEAHFNMLRVWGGGYYEDDRFYKLCDENGILVWQDFMFACAMYPGDSLFLQNVENELIDNIKRLRHHASIALWCGNNEIDEAWHNWGWQKTMNYSPNDSQAIWQDYTHLFQEMIPAMLSEYDPSRYYHPSSPTNGWGRQSAYTEGDVHYWGVWWGLEDYRKYSEKVGRFHSEYGMQALPNYTTILQFTEEKDRKLFSDALKNHQKHPTGFKNLDIYLDRDFPDTKDLRNYIYLTQLLQAEAMRTAIYAHRLAKPYCMGTLYWQLNDCWSGISWSSIDYYGNWKAAHYAIKEAFSPIVPIISERHDSLFVDFVSDKIGITEVSYTIHFQDFGGNNVANQSTTGIVKQLEFNKNRNILAMPIPKNLQRNSFFVQAILTYTENGKSEKSENFHYFAAPKNLKLTKNPKIVMELDKKNPQLLHISANTFVKNAYIYLENTPLHVSENYFDLPANTTKTVELPQDILDIRSLKVLSLNQLLDK